MFGLAGKEVGGFLHREVFLDDHWLINAVTPGRLQPLPENLFADIQPIHQKLECRVQIAQFIPEE